MTGTIKVVSIQFKIGEKARVFLKKTQNSKFDDLWYSLMGNIELSVNDSIVVNQFKGTPKDNEIAILSFFWCLLFSLRDVLAGKETIIEMEESDQSLIIKKHGDNFIILFDQGEFTPYSGDRITKREYTVNAIEFVKVAWLACQNFLDEMLKINGKLSQNNHIKKYIKELTIISENINSGITGL